MALTVMHPKLDDPELAQHGQRAAQLAVTELTVEPREDVVAGAALEEHGPETLTCLEALAGAARASAAELVELVDGDDGEREERAAVTRA